MAEINLVLLLFLNFMVFANAQVEADTPFGDVMLTCKSPYNPDKLGTVTVFYPEHGYVPVCREGFNRGAAAAVCRQLGFVDAIPSFDGGKKYYGDPTDIGCYPQPAEPAMHITRIKCPNVSNYAVDGELNVARCSLGNLTLGTAKCVDGIVAVECSSKPLESYPEYRYNGQVRFAHKKQYTDSYKGTVKVIISNEEYSLCSDRFTPFMANSVCRQLGYTNSRSSNPTSEYSTNSVNLLNSCVDDTANLDSFPCFSHCIDIDSYKISPIVKKWKLSVVSYMCNIIKSYS